MFVGTLCLDGRTAPVAAGRRLVEVVGRGAPPVRAQESDRAVGCIKQACGSLHVGQLESKGLERERSVQPALEIADAVVDEGCAGGA